MDEGGAWVIEPTFVNLASKPGEAAGISPTDDRRFGDALNIVPGVFTGDLFAVGHRTDDGSLVWGYIDRTGEIAIDGFAAALNYVGDYALVCPLDAQGNATPDWSIIDKSGMLTAGEIGVGDRITCVNAGYAFVEGSAGGSSGWACIDTSGAWALASAQTPDAPYVYADPLVFSEGVACATGDPFAQNAYTIIDTTGTTMATIGTSGVIDAAAEPCHEGLLFLNGALYGVQGNLIQGSPRAFVRKYRGDNADDGSNTGIEQAFSDHAYYSDGVCAVQEAATGLWGLIDTSGSFVVEPRWQNAFQTGQGLVCAKELATGLYGFVDASGSWVRSFSTSLTAVSGTSRVSIPPLRRSPMRVS